MAAALAGDGDAYHLLLAELIPWLRRYFRRRLPLSMTEDAVQDVLLAIHEKRHTYDPARPFAPWLAAVARYKWIDRMRGSSWDKTEPLDDNLSVPDHADMVIADKTFGDLLAGLKPSQAEAIRLVKIEGYSVAEAAETSGQSVALIKINVHRGLKRLAAVAQADADED